MNKIFGFLLISLLLTSCFSTRQLVIKDYSTEIIDLPFEFTQIEFVDKRDTVLPMIWDVPLTGIKHKEWIGNPILSDSIKTDIIRIIQQSGKKDGIPVAVEFRVIEGVCKLNANWKSVTEYAKFKGELYIDIPSRRMSSLCYAEIFYENSTLNGTEKHTVMLYNYAIRNVTHFLLIKAKEAIKLD